MVKLAFYKAHQGKIDDKLIAWWTKGKFSHVEIITGPDIDNLLMWTSSGMDGGVRQKKHIYDPTKWEYIDVDLDYNILLAIYNLTKNNKYDWWGIVGFILPFQDRENRWFCSEWVSNILKCSGNKKFYLLEPSKISPNKLYEIIKK